MRPTVFVSLLFFTLGAVAHPGGLDAKGGHTDRVTGVYHYHRKTNAPLGTVPGSQALPLQGPSTNPVSLSIDGETNPVEIETGAAELARMNTEPGSVSGPPGRPWWVYLVGLGCGYGVWEIASYYFQKKKGVR